MASLFYKKFLVIVVVILVIVALERRIFDSPLQDFVYRLYRQPGVVTGEKVGLFSRYIRGLADFREMVAENTRLASENAELLGRVSDLEKLKLENKLLREQLGLAERQENQLTLAKIFSLNRNGLVSTLLIDKGSADGVKKSMPVVSSSNVALGLVNEVFENSSSVMLLDDPRSIIAVRVSSQGVLATARGNLTGEVILDLVTNKDPVEAGDLVTTSGFDSLPEGLLVGRVEMVELKGGNLFKEVEVKLLFDLIQSPNLFVIIK